MGDFAREGTAALVETALMIKTFSTVRQVAQVSKVHSAEIYMAQITNTATKVPEVVAMTAEGAEIKIVQAAENCALSK